MARKGGLSRKELTEKDDITSTLEVVTDWVIDHAKPLGTAAAIVVIAVLAVVGWNYYSAAREANAQAALALVLRAYNDVVAEPDDEARFNATIEEAARVEAGHAGTQAADLARYYAALGQDGLGNTEESDRILRGLIESGDESIRDNARFALAESYKKREDFEAAIAEYRALSESPNFSRGAILYELGRLHEEISDPDQARAYYETLVNEYLESPYRTEADRALRRLRARDESSPS